MRWDTRTAPSDHRRRCHGWPGGLQVASWRRWLFSEREHSDSVSWAEGVEGGIVVTVRTCFLTRMLQRTFAGCYLSWRKEDDQGYVRCLLDSSTSRYFIRGKHLGIGALAEHTTWEKT